MGAVNALSLCMFFMTADQSSTVLGVREQNLCQYHTSNKTRLLFLNGFE